MIAARLGADQGTMAALENGDLSALPNDHETTRIVTAYGRMVGIDPTIALHRIALLREEAGAAMTQSTANRQTFVPPAQARGIDTGNALDASTGGWIAPSQREPGHGSGLAQMHAHAWPAGAGSVAQQSSAPRGQSNGVMRPQPRTAQANWLPPAPVQRPQTQPPLPYTQQQMTGPPARPAAVTNLSSVNPLQPPERPARPETDAAGRRVASRAKISPADDGVETSRRRHPARIALKYVTAPMMVVAGLWYTVQNPTSVHAALAQLPEPLPRIAQAGMEIVLVNTAPTKDGLRMITANDPRSRKADKLQVRREANK